VVKKMAFLQLSQLSQLFCINLCLFAQFAEFAKFAMVFFSLMILQLFAPCRSRFAPYALCPFGRSSPCSKPSQKSSTIPPPAPLLSQSAIGNRQSPIPLPPPSVSIPGRAKRSEHCCG
jgi:hypothetical protein